MCRCGTRRKGSTVDSLKSKGTEKKKSPVVGAVVTLGTWGAAVLRPFGDRCWMVRQICALGNSPRRRDVAEMGRSMLRPYMSVAAVRFVATISGWGVCRRRMRRRRQRRL